MALAIDAALFDHDQAMSTSNILHKLRVHRMNFSAEELNRGRAVIELKRKYEAIARRWKTFNAEQRRQHESSNFAPRIHPTTGEFVYALSPDHFLFAALGVSKWHHATYCSQESRLVDVDPWLVAGGLRKQAWIDRKPAGFQEFLPQLDVATRMGDRSTGSFTSWLQPLPLFWATEGKNRIQSYQDTNTRLLTSAETCCFLPAASLRLYQSVLDESVWLLRFVGGLRLDWRARMERQGGERPTQVVLPFPEVGVPLLRSYGVTVDRGWGLPWRITKGAQVRESEKIRAMGWS